MERNQKRIEKSFASKAFHNATEAFIIPQNDTSELILRHIRATSDENLTSAVEKMAKVARLTTGIHIQNGLIAGSIQADELVIELLRLGTVTPDQIISMNSTKLTGPLTELKNLPTSMKDSAEIKAVETKLETLEKIRKETETVGDGTKWVGRETFTNEMKLVKDGTVLQPVADVVKKINGWIFDSDKLNDSSVTIPEKKSVVGFLKTNMEKILKSVKQLVQTQDKFKYLNIETAEGALKPLTDLMKFVDSLVAGQASFSTVPNEKDNFQSNIGNVNRLAEVSKSLDVVVPDFDIIKALLESRASQSTKSLKFPGFSNGSSDLDKLFVDLSDKWLKKVIKIETMPKAFSPLKPLVKTFKSVGETLPAGDEKSAMIDKLLEKVKEIQNAGTDAPQIKKASEDMWECREKYKNIAQGNSTAVNDFIDTAKVLDAKMGEMKTHFTKFLKEMNDEGTKKLLNDVIGLCQTDADDNKMDAHLKALIDSQSLKDLKAKLESAAKLGGKVAVPEADVDVVIGKYGKVQTYLDSIKPAAGFLTCLSNLQNPALVTKGIALSRQYRGVKRVKRDVVTDGENVINSVVQSANDLKTLKTAIGSLKGKSTPQSDALKKFPDPDKNSKTIGLAAQGVTSMKKALDQKAQADVIILKPQVIRDNMDKVPDPTERANLDAVVQMATSLPAMYQKLDAWKNGLNQTNSDVLADQFNVFSSAASVPGVTGDLGAMSKSVEKLAKQVQDPTAKSELVAIQKALETFNSIGLDFASYTAQFTDSKQSLAALDVFFVNAAAAQSQSSGGAGQRGRSAVVKTTPPYDPTGVIWGVVGGVVGAAALGGGGYLIYRKKKKNAEKKKKKDSDPEDKKKDGSSGSGTGSNTNDVEAGKVEKGDDKGAPAAPAAAQGPKGELPPTIGPRELLPTPIVAEYYEEVLTRRATRQMVSLQDRENKRAMRAAQAPAKITLLAGFKSLSKTLLIAVDLETRAEVSILVDQHANECRHKIPLCERTRVILKNYGTRFPNSFMHANYVSFPNGLRMILTQAPQKAFLEKLSTIEKFWWMVVQEKTEFVVMLMPLEENDGNSCDKYFPNQLGDICTFENLTVMCMNKTMEGDRSILIRTLEITFSGEPPYLVKHFQYFDWPEYGAPEDSGYVHMLLDRTRESKKPVVVHCTDGIGRSGAFAFLELGYQTLCMKFNIHFASVLLELRSQRSDAIQKPIHLGFAAYAIAGCISRHFALKNSKIVALHDMYKPWSIERKDAKDDRGDELIETTATEEVTRRRPCAGADCGFFSKMWRWLWS